MLLLVCVHCYSVRDGVTTLVKPTQRRWLQSYGSSGGTAFKESYTQSLSDLWNTWVFDTLRLWTVQHNACWRLQGPDIDNLIILLLNLIMISYDIVNWVIEVLSNHKVLLNCQLSWLSLLLRVSGSAWQLHHTEWLWLSHSETATQPGSHFMESRVRLTDTVFTLRLSLQPLRNPACLSQGFQNSCDSVITVIYSADMTLSKLGPAAVTRTVLYYYG